VPQPIVPQQATKAVQPHAGNAFPLPANFTLKPRGGGQPPSEPIQKNTGHVRGSARIRSGAIMSVIQRNGATKRQDCEYAVDADYCPAPISNLYPAGVLLKKKNANPRSGEWPTDTYFVAENVDDLDSPIHPVEASTINDHFDPEYLPYGFTRKTGPDPRQNCGDYAAGRELRFDSTNHQVMPESATMVIDNRIPTVEHLKALGSGWYVYSTGYHFIRFDIPETGKIVVSQKNGPSAIYEAKMDAQELANYLSQTTSNPRGVYRML